MFHHFRDNNEGYEIRGAQIPGLRSRGGKKFYGGAQHV
jgi:hypothetical protein